MDIYSKFLKDKIMPPEDFTKNLRSLSKILADDFNADLAIYNGDITQESAMRFILTVREKKTKDNIYLILSTNGGNADAAYKIARYLKKHYKKFTVYITHACKSAGTLIVCGADEIIFSDFGELGPLDVQLPKEDELTSTSGLCYSQAISFLQTQAFQIFESFLLGIKERSQGTITTKTAADIGEKIAVGLLSPITHLIDPLKLGEIVRSANIAHHYGMRLSKNQPLIASLISGYPSHSFVIDFVEAKELFGNMVRELNEKEKFLELCQPDLNKFICVFVEKGEEQNVTK
jgi:hypothetical protein